MPEFQPRSVQHMTRRVRPPDPRSSINFIAKHGMAKVRHVYADLVSASGMDTQSDEGGLWVNSQAAERCQRRTSPLGERHFFSLYGVSPDGGINGAFQWRSAMH